MKKSAACAESVNIKHLHSISQIVNQASNWKTALDEITKFVRTFFIFDNLVVYLSNPHQDMEVFYAKALGRGKSAEADASWGESIANRIAQSHQVILEKPDESKKENRLKQPHILGVPLLVNNNLLGALVLIRFGGPEFTPDDVFLTEFIANQISQIIHRDKLQQKNDILRTQQEQNQLRDDFISTITHELRNPLGFIKGYTTTLLRSDTTWDQATQEEFLQIIDQETDHLQELIDNILDSARLKSGQLKMKFSQVRLDALLKDVQLRSQMNDPGKKVILHCRDGLTPILADSRRLSQVFENLINNAKKYAPESDIEIQIYQTEDFSNIQVRDFGQGIPEKYLPFIFDRFFRNPEQSPNIHGSGLGLYICKKIIQEHNGKIEVESEIGKGTTFHLAIPNAQELLYEDRDLKEEL